MVKMAEICQEPKWVLSLAKAADKGSAEGWCGGQRGPPQRLRQWLKLLTKSKHLSAGTVSHIERYFSPQKVQTQPHLSQIASRICSEACPVAGAGQRCC